MRSLTTFLPAFITGKFGAGSRTASSKRNRVPRRDYPLWRRIGVRVSSAIILCVGGGLWAWFGGYVDTARASAEDLFAQSLNNLGFTVQKVTVAGRDETSTEELLAALQVSRGHSLFALDCQAAKDRVEALGWVKTAAVSRLWPDTIHLELVERRPFARWQKKRHLAVIDREGAVITSKEMGRFAALPVVVGAGARYAAAHLIDVLATEPGLFHRVEAATRVGGRRWNLHFDNGIEIRLPADDEALAWQRLALLEQDYRILGRDIEAIDLRLPDRLIVRVTNAGVQRMRDPGKEA